MPENKKIILHVAGSAQWAGGEVFLKHLFDGLDPARFSFRVVCPEAGPLLGEMERRGIPVVTIPLAPLGHPGPLKALRNKIREWTPHLVQSHGARATFYSRLAARGLCPHVATVHNALEDYPVSALRKKIYTILDTHTSSMSRRIVFVAESLRKSFLKRAGPMEEKTRVIHNGVDTNRFKFKISDRTRMRKLLNLGDCRTLGIIGRMTSQKGHFILLDALRSWNPNPRTTRLLLVGDGPLRARLEDRVTQLGLGPLCQFLGVRSDIPALLSAMDVVVLPSLSEGLPYTVLEAMAMERPVVASRVNGVEEIFTTGREGYLIKPGDASSLLQTLKTLADHPEEAQSRAARGYARVNSRFTKDHFLRQWSDFYQTLLSGGHS